MSKEHNCWHCGKKLTHTNEEHFFHCNKECQKACKTWNAKVETTEEDLGYKILPLGQVELIEELPEATKTKSKIIYHMKGKVKIKSKESLPPCHHKNNCKAHRELCVPAGHDPNPKKK